MLCLFPKGKNCSVEKAAAAEQLLSVLVRSRVKIGFMKWQCAVSYQCIGKIADGEIEKKNYIRIGSVRVEKGRKSSENPNCFLALHRISPDSFDSGLVSIYYRLLIL